VAPFLVVVSVGGEMGEPVDNPDRIRLDPITPVAKARITVGTINFPPGWGTVPDVELGIHAPRYKSRLILNCGYQILFEEPIPNRFWRFWQWFLLGWKWQKL
jgi:hypothetical protein